MSAAHDRLRKIERRLEEVGAQPLYTKKQVRALDDVQADMALRAEIDRLALLMRLEAESQTLPARRKTT